MEQKKYMPSVIGNEQIRQRLSADVLCGAVSHAYIFEGAAGTGKFTLALQLAAALSCLNADDGDALPCGECEHCRKILSGLTPDVTGIDCVDGKASISKEQISQMISTICFAPNQMRRRVIIIKNAQLMTKEAQNALLLTLEEPPEYVLFLLLTENAKGLLETVRSRAPALRLCALDAEMLTKELLERSDAARALRASSREAFDEIVLKAQGSLGLALRLLDPTESERLRAVRRLTDEALAALSGGDRGILRFFELCDDPAFKDRERTGEVFLSIQSALRDLLVAKRCESFSGLCYYTDAAACEERSDAFTVQELVRLYERIEEARIAICTKNANARLTLATLAQDCFGA